MKIRNGFISNSSSASFVIYWRSLDGDELTVNEAIDKLLPYADYKSRLKECTEKTASSEIYKTTGGTSMYNDAGDFPQEMAYLVLALKVVSGYELIDLHVECEG